MHSPVFLFYTLPFSMSRVGASKQQIEIPIDSQGLPAVRVLGRGIISAEKIAGIVARNDAIGKRRDATVKTDVTPVDREMATLINTNLL
jgi:hypothetical protein